jgi:hypothetical protein
MAEGNVGYLLAGFRRAGTLRGWKRTGTGNTITAKLEDANPLWLKYRPLRAELMGNPRQLVKVEKISYQKNKITITVAA